MHMGRGLGARRPPRKRWGSSVARGAAIAAAAIGLAACGSGTAEPTVHSTGIPTSLPTTAMALTPETAGASHSVVYRVTGTEAKSVVIYVTYGGEQGESQQATVRLPWTTSFRARAGEFLYVAGQGSSTGTLACEILVDGKSVRKAEKNTSGGVASCELVLGATQPAAPTP